MRGVYIIGILLLMAVFPIRDGKFTPNIGFRAGSGHLDPGDIRAVKFETAGGNVKGNVSADIVPVIVWIIPQSDYESTDSFSTAMARFYSHGLFNEFYFDSTTERELVLIIINNNNETQDYEFIIEYEFPLNLDGSLFSLGTLMGLLILAIPVICIIIFLKRREIQISRSAPISF